MAEPRRDTAVSERDLDGARVLIVEARFYGNIGDALMEGATAAVQAAGARHDHLVVQGALEIPAMAAIALDAAAKAGTPYDAVVALGCVIRGETFHFEIVSQESARALMDLAVTRRLPLGNGILTVENEAQAWARARRGEGDKGGDAVRAAFAVLRHQRRLSKGQ